MDVGFKGSEECPPGSRRTRRGDVPAVETRNGTPSAKAPEARARYDALMQDDAAPTLITSVGELEALVLSALWEKGQLSTPDVFDEVGVPRGLAYTTILTVLQRLHRKGLVTRKASGKSHVYSPALSREQFSERRGEVLAAAMVKLGSAGLSAFLSEADRLDPEFMAQLRTQLKELGS